MQLLPLAERIREVKHEMLHADGVQRLSTMIKIGTRTDKETSLEDKLVGFQ